MLPLILVAVGAYLIGDSVLEGGKKLAKGGETDGGKIKFYDVVKSITDLEYDRDPEDLRLHHEERFNWGADNEKDYEKAENEIENLTYSGKGWTVYATTDVSGYNYWMKNQGEQNYISIAVMFDKDTIDESEVENLRKALGNAIDDAENIAYKYDYVPEDDDDDDDDYKKGGKMAKGGKLVGKQKNLDVNKNGKLDAEDFKMLRKGKKMADGGLVVKSDEDLREIAKYMVKAIKKRADFKDLVVYFEKDNNYDYKYRVKIFDEMNVYEMKKTEENIYKVLKAIVEANEAKK